MSDQTAAPLSMKNLDDRLRAFEESGVDPVERASAAELSDLRLRVHELEKAPEQPPGEITILHPTVEQMLADEELQLVNLVSRYVAGFLAGAGKPLHMQMPDDRARASSLSHRILRSSLFLARETLEAVRGDVEQRRTVAELKAAGAAREES